MPDEAHADAAAATAVDLLVATHAPARIAKMLVDSRAKLNKIQKGKALLYVLRLLRRGAHYDFDQLRNTGCATSRS